MLMCGDWWQLPPVRSIAIFSNPFQDSQFGEQTILNMFWKRNVDSLQGMHELTQQMRCKDQWWRCVLDEDRHGQESWETYCFIHGLPTRNVGSWLKDEAVPSCGQASCKKLADVTWPRMFGAKISWEVRKQLECDVCKVERRRRRRVLNKTDRDDKIHLMPPFADATFVHPFNAPKYHAQQLRAMNFAKATARQLLWIIAYDTPIASGEENIGREALEKMRARWLELHDRATGGIMGMFPGVKDMPVRFTGTEDREQGVFKHSRGWLRGWILPAAEHARIMQLGDPEIVLVLRPKTLLIEVETATAAMPDTYGKNIYALNAKQRTWSRTKEGQADVRRIGFPLVPDFASTAHGVCGSTLEAGLGDLLAWNKRPTREDMLRSYIIKSRVKEADKFLIVQPYSPELFRQGELPGPHLLMDALRGTLSGSDLKKAWKQTECHDAEKKKRTEWPAEMLLPCRTCTDKSDGEEMRKPLRAFSTYTKVKDLWENVVARGQDLQVTVFSFILSAVPPKGTRATYRPTSSQ